MIRAGKIFGTSGQVWALPDQHLELLSDNRAAGRRRARPGEPDAGAAAAGPVDDVRALRVVCVRVAGDHLQADWKRVHLVVAAQVVIELPLWRPDLLAVLEERRHPVGRLVGLWLAGRAPSPQARGGRARVRRLVAEEGVGVRAAGLPRIDDRVVVGRMAEAAVRVEVVAMKLGRRRSGRGTRAEQRRREHKQAEKKSAKSHTDVATPTAPSRFPKLMHPSARPGCARGFTALGR